MSHRIGEFCVILVQQRIHVGPKIHEANKKAIPITKINEVPGQFINQPTNVGLRSIRLTMLLLLLR